MAANNPTHGEAIIIAVDASIGGKKLIASDQFQSFLDELGELVNTIGDGEAQTLVTISAQLGKAKAGISRNSKEADDLEQVVYGS